MKYVDDEPTFLQTEEPDSHLGKLLNWYSYHKNSTDAKKYFLAHLKPYRISTDLYNKVKKVDISNTIGWLARIVERSSIVPEKYVLRLKEETKKILDKARLITLEEEVIEVNKPNIQDYINQKAQSLYFDIEEHFDAVIENRKIIQYSIKVEEFNSIIAERVHQKISNGLFLELSLALKNSTDEEQQCAEAYSFLGKELPKIHEHISSILNQLEEIIKKKQIRKPRKKKIKTPQELVKKVKILKQYEKYVSVAPEKIIGAETLVVFNIKTRFLGIYQCANNHGFSVKGTTILNFDETSSISKKLRKPEQQLKLFVNGGNIALKNALSKIKAKEKRLNGRLNCDTIILKVL